MEKILSEKIEECKKYIDYTENYDKEEIYIFVTSITSLFDLKDCAVINSNDEFDEDASLQNLYDSLRYNLEKEDSFDKDKIIKQLTEKIKSLESQINISLVQNQTSNQLQNVNLLIDFEQVMESVENIPNSVLNEDDKEIFIGKLSGLIKLAKENNKDQIWNRARGILTWVADKGIDAGIAILPTIPFVVQLVQNIK